MNGSVLKSNVGDLRFAAASGGTVSVPAADIIGEWLKCSANGSIAGGIVALLRGKHHA
jgi:hypothetical protein